MIAALEATIIAMGMSSMMGAMGAGMAAGSSFSKDPREELNEVDERLYKLGFVIERYQTSVVGTRKYKSKLMQSFGLTILPSVVEMKAKYPQLYATDRNLRVEEKELERLELRRMFLKKRQKQLMQALGLTAVEEPGPRVVVPAMKKFVPRTREY